MRNLLILAFLAVPLMFAGCAAVDYTADRVAAAVDHYCAAVDPMERAVVRAQIDAKTPHRVRVECAEQ